MSTHQPKKKTNKTFLIILIAVLIVGGGFGATSYVHSLHHEETEDAQVETNINPVIPRISGYIADVRVNDNQHVKKGDTLLILDDREMKVKLQQAEAALATAQSNLGSAKATTVAAKANIATSQASVAAADAQIEAAKVNVWRATEDYKRYENLIKDHSITQQQYEQALAAKQSAEKQLQILEQQKNQASRQSSAVASQSKATGSQIDIAEATIKERETELSQAKLNLSYTVITASEDGTISKVNVREGQYVQSGTSLFSIVRDNVKWVVANFKETQLENIREGEKVLVTADAFPGHEFTAEVSSFSPATGARFALLPPDNASGNFVKVVQRLPVKIEFTNPEDSLINRLRAGLNVNVDVLIN
jgi:membrane fusion protein (multidrug efflux system)